MSNEIIFLLQTVAISASCAIAYKLKREALIALLCIQAILANIFVTKQVILGGFCVTCTDVFTIGCALCLNLLQELGNKKDSLRAIYISFFTLIFYTIMSQFHLTYIPAACDITNEHFKIIFEPMPRIILASLFAYFVSQHIDTYLYSFLNSKFKNFILKNYGSIIVSQLVDTLLFSLLGLYMLVENIWDIILVSYFIKVLAVIIVVPITRLIIKKI